MLYGICTVTKCHVRNLPFGLLHRCAYKRVGFSFVKYLIVVKSSNNPTARLRTNWIVLKSSQLIPKCDEFISCFWAAAQSVPIVPLDRAYVILLNWSICTKKDTSLQSYSSASVLVSCVINIFNLNLLLFYWDNCCIFFIYFFCCIQFAFNYKFPDLLIHHNMRKARERRPVPRRSPRAVR